MKIKIIHSILAIFSLAMITSCSMNHCPDNFSVQNLSITPQANNVLRYNVSYTLPDTLPTVIQYWEKNKPEIIIQRNISKSKHIREVLYGFKPLTQYVVKISYDIHCNNNIKTHSFTTPSIPYSQLSQFEIITNTSQFNGNVLFQQAVGPGGQLYTITNELGVPIWYQYYPKTISAFSWTPNNTLLAILSDDEIIEIDLKGDTVFHLDLSAKEKIHHEIRKTKENKYYTLGRISKSISEFKKSSPLIDSVKTDCILVFDKLGNKIWDWSLFDIETPDITTMDQRTSRDWGHANAVWLDENGNYLISYKNFSQIYKIDGETGSLIWKFGQGGDFQMEASDIFFEQHAVFLDSEDQLVLFDNGSKKTEISRGLAFKIDETQKTYQLISKAELPNRLYSIKRGNATWANNGLMIISSSLNNTIAVVNSNSDIVWEMKLPYYTYRAEYIPKIPID